ncbi:MAG: peptidoglycan editing factor PgeF [Armatimonadetes bacterium]|nr:peptidoglycan editing factor PgeF [Armatimonadota bacterium]
MNPLDLLFAENLRRAGIPHAFTTRRGGVSPPPFDSLNLGRGVHDDSANVARNRAAILRAIGIDPSRHVEASQVHGATVAVVTARDAAGVIEGADGMVTSAPGLALAIHAADCVPVLLADPRRRVVAAVHAGWRGSAAGIALEAVGVLADRFESRAEDLLVAIGPAIKACHYEVDEPVFDRYRDWPWRDELFAPNARGRWQLDLQAVNRRQLMDAGVPAAQIEVLEHCTFDRPDLFFSYRRDRETGRMGAIIALSD